MLEAIYPMKDETEKGILNKEFVQLVLEEFIIQPSPEAQRRVMEKSFRKLVSKAERDAAEKYRRLSMTSILGDDYTEVEDMEDDSDEDINGDDEIQYSVGEKGQITLNVSSTQMSNNAIEMMKDADPIHENFMFKCHIYHQVSRKLLPYSQKRKLHAAAVVYLEKRLMDECDIRPFLIESLKELNAGAITEMKKVITHNLRDRWLIVNLVHHSFLAGDEKSGLAYCQLMSREALREFICEEAQKALMLPDYAVKEVLHASSHVGRMVLASMHWISGVLRSVIVQNAANDEVEFTSTLLRHARSRLTYVEIEIIDTCK